MRNGTSLKMICATALIGVFIVMGFAACGQNSYTAAAVPVPATASGLDPDNCSVGMVDAPGYGCLSQASCPAGTGYATNVNPPQCVTGTLITQSMLTGTGGALTYIGILSVQNQQQFDLLMQWAGQCNPYTSGVNYGAWNCDSWTTAGYVAIQFSSTIPGPGATASGQMIVGAGSLYGQSIKFASQAAAVLYNNSAGMQIVGTYSGQDQGLRLIVNNGLIGQASSMQATLRYQNVTVGTVNLVPQ